MFTKLSHVLSQPYFLWIEKLLKAYPGAEVFLVGGAVRDAVLGRETKDYDFVIRGVQSRHLQEFLSSAGIVNLVGRSFGVYKFVPDQGYEEFKNTGMEAFDVALPRTENAWGTGGYRDVEVQSDHELPIEKDLGRRDFTINAIAIRLNSRFSIPGFELSSKPDLVDPYGGLLDIKAKIIKAVGSPLERFNEDYTRMLRALRFACQLGFAIEKSTMEALGKVMLRLNDKRDLQEQHGFQDFVAPREVVSREFLRAFYTDPVRAFDLCDESGVFEMLTPELLKMKQCPQPEEYHSEGDVWVHTRMALSMLGSKEYVELFGKRGEDLHYNALLVMTILFHDIGKPYMIQTPEADGVDHIHFREHATVGAELAREISKRLILSIMPGDKLHIGADKLWWMIHHHLLLLNTKPEDLKAATVEKYFFNEKNPGEEFLRLMFCDGSASVPKNGQPDLSALHGMIARIKRMAQAVHDKKITPKSFLSGDEIMEILGVPAGPGIGEIKNALCEEQLSARVLDKDAAIAFIKECFG